MRKLSTVNDLTSINQIKELINRIDEKDKIYKEDK